MEKIWLQSYPPGVPGEIDPDQYRSLVHLLDEALDRYADRNAFVCLDRFLRYAELDAHAKKMAAWLQSRGMQKGARVAIMLPNVLQYPIALIAVLRAGYVAVNINPQSSASELEYELKDSGSEAVILLENFGAMLEQALPNTQVRHVIVTSVGEMLGWAQGALVNFFVRDVKRQVPLFTLPNMVRFRQALGHGSKMTLSPVELQPSDCALLQYTDGTAGLSKGVALSHRNIIANLLQSEAWARPALGHVAPTQQLLIACALPLYHAFTLTGCALWGLRTGAMNILIPDPRDTAGMVRELGKYPFGVLLGVNTLFRSLLNHAAFYHLDFSGLKIVIGGGMPVEQGVSERWLKATGVPLVEGYGLCETSPIATCSRTDATGFTGNAGLPLPSTDIAILDDTGRQLGSGTPGEIAVRGPQVMMGYWNRPRDTARAMTEDGFFKSGDLGIMDSAGYVSVLDRKSDVIQVSGLNVYPNELESAIGRHPGVRECAVVGVSDGQGGQAVKLFVVRKDAGLTQQALATYCREHFAAYKQAKYIEFRDQLPKTQAGKLMRRALRDEVPVA
jgi:long-chain acyl-CoA synthetase